MKLYTFNKFAILCVAGLTFASCKKNQEEMTPVTTPGTEVSRAELTQDSIFLYAKEVYLWNTGLPEYAAFNPRQYSADSAGFGQELYDITQYSPVNASTGFPYEYTGYDGETKYSYIDDISQHNVLAAIKNTKSSVDLEGIGNDFGLKVAGYSIATSDIGFAIYVQAVYQNSPADLSKLTRGCLITKINGKTYGANFDNEINAVYDALEGATVTLEGTLKDGVTPFNVTLTKKSYASSPIYSAKVLDVNGTKVGYLAYARFSSLDNSQAEFDAAFAKFATAGVTKLVVDLRYNGGGYVSTAEYLVNLILPATHNGEVMFKERYNTMMQTGTATIMKNQPLYNSDGSFQFIDGRVANYTDLAKDYFSEAKQVTNISKKGPLSGVTDVAFIVTRNTASASELVINSLKPYLNVKIAGTNSYGKPVGFFPITIDYKLNAATQKESGYDIYYSMFQTTNSLGEGDYFDGFTPDLVLNGDDATHDFGDLEENNLAKAVSLIVPSALSTTASTMSIRGKRVTKSSVVVRKIYDGNEFNGMIAKRPSLKK